MFSPGDVVILSVKLGEKGELRNRPVVVLFEEYTSVVVVGMTSSPYVRGIQVTKGEGAVKDSTIKLNQIFTVDREVLSAPLFKLSREKKKLLFERLVKLLGGLNE